MGGYLLDTNVLSELVKAKPDVGVIRFLGGLSDCYISVLTIHELYFGIESIKDNSAKKDALNFAIEELTATFKGNILSINNPEARVAASMRADAKKKGKVVHVIDSLIGATAYANGLTVITRNEKDFEELHVSVINPWLK